MYLVCASDLYTSTWKPSCCPTSFWGCLKLRRSSRKELRSKGATASATGYGSSAARSSASCSSSSQPRGRRSETGKINGCFHAARSIQLRMLLLLLLFCLRCFFVAVVAVVNVVVRCCVVVVWLLLLLMLLLLFAVVGMDTRGGT